MTHPDPQAAPPETDPRGIPTAQLIADLNDSVGMLEAALTGDPVTLFDVDVASSEVALLRMWLPELLRRLARPDALREKVMDALERKATSRFNLNPPYLHIDEIKAAVAAVLEDQT